MSPSTTPTLGALVDDAAETHGAATALRDQHDHAVSFESLARRVGRARARLHEWGCRPGDHVALVMGNGLDWPVAWLGIVTAGMVAVPISTRSGSDDLAWVLDHAAVGMALVDGDRERLVEAVGRQRPIVSVRRLHSGWADQGSSVPHAEVPVDRLANIQYTSGTTGFPKGCRLSHRFWWHMGRAMADHMSLRPDSVVVTAQPFSYIDPMWNTVAALCSGAELVILDGFHPSTFMEAVRDFSVTTFYCLAAMPTLLLKQPPSPADDVPLLERVFCSAIPATTHAELERRWGAPWTELYGMTETGLNIAVTSADHDELVGSGSIGTTADHCDATVVDEAGTPLPDGEVGQLVVRGTGFMDGYHDDDDATAAFFANGWAHTGDLAVRDRNGRFTLRGRRMHLIRRGGENIAPGQVEAVLVTHPDVAEAAVVGVDDDVLGQEVRAVIVGVAGRQLDVVAICTWLQPRLASFKVPRFWEVRESLPRTPSERVAMHRLGPMGAGTVDVSKRDPDPKG